MTPLATVTFTAPCPCGTPDAHWTASLIPHGATGARLVHHIDCPCQARQDAA